MPSFEKPASDEAPEEKKPVEEMTKRKLKLMIEKTALKSRFFGF